jgi:hypothetical protein
MTEREELRWKLKAPFTEARVWRTGSYPARFSVEVTPPVDTCTSKQSDLVAVFIESAIREAIERAGKPEPPREATGMDERNRELGERITNYLSNGGLFNPESMEHDKVRKLLIDCRQYLAFGKAVRPAAEPNADWSANNALRSAAIIVEERAKQWAGVGDVGSTQSSMDIRAELMSAAMEIRKLVGHDHLSLTSHAAALDSREELKAHRDEDFATGFEIGVETVLNEIGVSKIEKLVKGKSIEVHRVSICGYVLRARKGGIGPNLKRAERLKQAIREHISALKSRPAAEKGGNERE